MKIQVLQVPDCPHAAMLVARLTELLGDDVPVDQVNVDDEDQARSLGMRGSPTLLLDGTDPFPTDQPASLAGLTVDVAAGIDDRHDHGSSPKGGVVHTPSGGVDPSRRGRPRTSDREGVNRPSGRRADR